MALSGQKTILSTTRKIICRTFWKLPMPASSISHVHITIKELHGARGLWVSQHLLLYSAPPPLSFEPFKHIAGLNTSRDIFRCLDFCFQMPNATGKLYWLSSKIWGTREWLKETCHHSLMGWGKDLRDNRDWKQQCLRTSRMSEQVPGFQSSLCDQRILHNR